MENDIIKAIELLKTGKTGKVGKNIFTVENAVVFRDIKEGYHAFNRVQEVIAVKTNAGVILGNSSRMVELEDRRFKNSINPARVQRLLSEYVTMIPFSVFLEAGLDLLTCEIVDAGPAETLIEFEKKYYGVSARPIERHFTGARLFKANTKNMTFEVINGESVRLSKYFLVDVDRREVDHGIINFFLAELPAACSTIADAYSMLKPNEVKMFEENTGVEVPRQGEFFFIPTALLVGQVDGDVIREIRVGNSRPNRVEIGLNVDGTLLVSGTVSHTGREHADLTLDSRRLFKVVPNTSKANFQLTGDID